MTVAILNKMVAHRARADAAEERWAALREWVEGVRGGEEFDAVLAKMDELDELEEEASR